MTYAIITSVEYPEEATEDDIHAYRANRLAALQEFPGFETMMAVKTGARTAVGIMLWKSEQDANEALAEIAKRQLTELQLSGEVQRGEVVFSGP